MRTRTYAEICARQGQLDEAISIYQELIVKKPDDATLVARARELALEREGLAAAGLLPPPPAPEPEPAAPPPSRGAAPPARPLPTDLPPRSAGKGKRKGAAAPPLPQAAALDADALARLRELDRLERLLHRIQNRRRRTHA